MRLCDCVLAEPRLNKSPASWLVIAWVVSLLFSLRKYLYRIISIGNILLTSFSNRTFVFHLWRWPSFHQLEVRRKGWAWDCGCLNSTQYHTAAGRLKWRLDDRALSHYFSWKGKHFDTWLPCLHSEETFGLWIKIKNKISKTRILSSFNPLSKTIEKREPTVGEITPLFEVSDPMHTLRDGGRF